jgi:hypothetical protein
MHKKAIVTLFVLLSVLISLVSSITVEAPVESDPFCIKRAVPTNSPSFCNPKPIESVLDENGNEKLFTCVALSAGPNGDCAVNPHCVVSPNCNDLTEIPCDTSGVQFGEYHTIEPFGTRWIPYHPEVLAAALECRKAKSNSPTVQCTESCRYPPLVPTAI